LTNRRLTNAYWIEVGVQRERMRVVELLEQHQCTFTDVDVVKCWCGSFNEAIELIKIDPLKELQRLAEETGEHEHFDNPLSDKDD